MKLVSWNVNGIRAVLGKGLPDYFRQEQPDVLCLQETRASAEQVTDVTWFDGYRAYWNLGDKKGYSGTAILTRKEPLRLWFGVGSEPDDREGRVITAEFEEFYLVNVYTPNSRRELGRLTYRTQVWDPLFLSFLKKLEETKPVVFCGDLNVAHREIDLARPKANVGNAGFTPEERASFDRIVESGFLDTFREFHSEGGHYTWWSFQSQARARNVGWRIDYFLISPSLRPRLKDAFIRCDVPGSDHCPVGIILESAGEASHTAYERKPTPYKD